MEKAGPGVVIYCSCNRNQAAEVYCEKHNALECVSCHNVKHNKCKTIKVEQKHEGDASSKQDEVMAKTINATQLTEADSKQLKDATSDDRSANMFTADIQETKNFMECNNMLLELENYFKKSELALENNKILEKNQNDTDALGNKTVCYIKKENKAQKLLKTMKVTSVKQVSVRQDDDKGKHWISGCTFMPNDYLVLCDWSNLKITLLDSAFKLVDKLKVRSGPWSLSAVGSDRVIVTLPGLKQLQYVQVIPEMKCGTKIYLDNECVGIAVSDNKIFVSCEASKTEGGDVRILDFEGNQKRKIDLKQTRPLPLPDYLTIDSINKMIFVSNIPNTCKQMSPLQTCQTIDRKVVYQRSSPELKENLPKNIIQNPSSVTCLTFDGKVVYQCSSPELKEVYGIYVDTGDNAYVCDKENNSVHIIARDGRHSGTLIGPAHELKNPCSIAVREKDGTVVIGCWDSDNILLFKLS